mgnify:CR=1 FL=1
MKKKRTPVPLIRSVVILNRDRQRVKSRTGVNLVLRIVGLLVIIALLAVGLVIGMGVGSAAAAYNMITANLPTSDEVAAASVERQPSVCCGGCGG